MKSLRKLLLPFSWLYAFVMHTRNFMFDKGILSSKSYKLPVISVGNITVGGTGKTPLTEHVIRLLLPNQRCAMLSRGYGRKTRGVFLADDSSDYMTIGDEPMQMQSKFKDLTVVVAEKRQAGMELLLSKKEPPEVVVLDDAYQHRYVKPGFSILVMDYHRPMWKDFCFPAGNLREPLSGIKRANLIVVNKVPSNLSLDEADAIRKKLKKSDSQQVFFTSVVYKNPEPLLKNNAQDKSFQKILDETNMPLIAIAGIGNPEPFFKMAREFGVSVSTIRFPDHHDFSKQDILNIEEKGRKEGMPEPLILTTEKDAIRLDSNKHVSEQMKSRIWYIPIELEFLFGEQVIFDKKIKDYVGKN
ncbi:tetraacyldisaccharide 4'-kinase [Alkalitalea saponilacus]|uniref:Tetraacyldisaccharide 4'-kinase n=1 Tax=Alkalitalea saponilacus TaxID=889453 RepID=A0A1T5HNK9_9BACT|nr:tetraacyldisaccharide 4'-kinase [Alkalitalea saponilacus]ASB49330.1 tetraacyldisaccharide 4'-kinase [Alkalitalea saponilacus]SKC22256.1 lipid-A-disaccharide kinase [Alkalitalea saponilacus]